MGDCGKAFEAKNARTFSNPAECTYPWRYERPLRGRLWLRRHRRRNHPGSRSRRRTQNRLCAAQSVAALVTPAVIAAWPGGWWLGPAVGRRIAGVAVRKDVQAWRGEDCGC